MKFRSFAILAALAAMSAPLAVRAKDDTTPIVLSAVDQTLVDRSIARGDMLYAYDQAAWHGTDDLQEKAKAAGVWDKLAPTLGGWIVDGTAAEPVLVFIDKSDRAQAVYTARFADNGTRLIESKLLGAGDDRSISPARMKLVVALRAARTEVARAQLDVCANAAFNSVVLPPETPDGPTLVYFLTPQTQNGIWPMGGHYLVEVKADSSIGSTRPFTKSCINTGAPPKGSPAAMFITHLLDPVPTEIHVFTMRAARLPLFVATTQNNRLWSIERVGGATRIRAMEMPKK
ncbi:hypothetical protein [Sphingomonas bacterium]|uniref:hypothetical protein n=1 Tax=Sphingomonas bacterium TaxID=1895847 RepID=UPI002601A05F|nr:hypothetical protein [Sphingomonas bacterium]MDB5677972.1 hypothetical protein [Sphingomonas bacterium]